MALVSCDSRGSGLVMQGSTCAFVERILRCAGVRTGLYSSPHLIDVRERIRLDGDLVPEAAFLKEFEYCWVWMRGGEGRGGEGRGGWARSARTTILVLCRCIVGELT